MWLPRAQVTRAARLPGGDFNEVYRVDTDGGPFVLNISHPSLSGESVRWQHKLMSLIHQHIVEVPIPLALPAGDTAVEQDGRIISFWPFVEGEHLERGNLHHLQMAARMLARLHHAASLILSPPSFMVSGVEPRPDHPAWARMDWRHNRLWDWPSIDYYLANTGPDIAQGADPKGIRLKLEEGLAEIPPSLKELTLAYLPTLPIHGDYYRRNLLQKHGAIAGVLDWDEARLDWRAWDIAQAVWEFGQDPVTRDKLDKDAAGLFLREYRSAGGEITPAELESFPLIMRAKLLWDVLYQFGMNEVSTQDNWAYIARVLRAREHLRGVDLRSL